MRCSTFLVSLFCVFDQSFTYLRKFMDGNVLVVTNITHFPSCLSIIFSHLILKSLPKEAFFFIVRKQVLILLYDSSGTGVINLVLLCNVEIESHHWIVYLCSAWAQGGFSWLTENWKIIFLSRERHWRPLINRIPQEKSCRKDFTPNNSVIAAGNIISLLSFTSLYNHVYQNTLNFVQSC